MSDNIATSLVVSIRELPSVHVACIEYKANVEPGDLHNQIGECFRRVQTWVRERGYGLLTQLTIGAIQLVNGQLASYACCVQIPGEVHSGSEEVDIRELPGGRYALVSIEKDPQIIGASIGGFYQEYAPQHNLEVDDTRLTYEIYYENTMEYCVPIL